MSARITIAFLLFVALTTEVLASKRVALVIGNSAYMHTPALRNPKNDAADMVTVLEKFGFHVLKGLDLGKVELEHTIRDFSEALSGAQVGVFFYAGHGLQISGQNYIVPIDAHLTTASSLDFEMVPLALIQRIMERESTTNVLFLDACRDNPLARNLRRSMGTRSLEVGSGLAAVESGAGTLISFSTQPGNVALEGKGRNSPFAWALLKHLSTSRDDLGAILIAVRKDVMKHTQGTQVPWEHSALTERFYFAPSGLKQGVGETPDTVSGISGTTSDTQERGLDGTWTGIWGGRRRASVTIMSNRVIKYVIGGQAQNIIRHKIAGSKLIFGGRRWTITITPISSSRLAVQYNGRKGVYDTIFRRRR